MSFLQNKVREALQKAGQIYDDERQEMLNECFNISKKAEDAQKENQKIKSLIDEIIRLSESDACQLQEGEYRKGWADCLKSISTKLKSID